VACIASEFCMLAPDTPDTPTMHLDEKRHCEGIARPVPQRGKQSPPVEHRDCFTCGLQ